MIAVVLLQDLTRQDVYEAVFEALACWIPWLSCAIRAANVYAANYVAWAIITGAEDAMLMLPQPEMPEVELESGPIGFLNYFLPLGALVDSFGVWMGAWGVYRGVQVALRWARAED